MRVYEIPSELNTQIKGGSFSPDVVLLSVENSDPESIPSLIEPLKENARSIPIVLLPEGKPEALNNWFEVATEATANLDAQKLFQDFPTLEER